MFQNVANNQTKLHVNLCAQFTVVSSCLEWNSVFLPPLAPELYTSLRLATPRCARTLQYASLCIPFESLWDQKTKFHTWKNENHSLLRILWNKRPFFHWMKKSSFFHCTFFSLDFEVHGFQIQLQGSHNVPTIEQSTIFNRYVQFTMGLVILGLKFSFLTSTRLRIVYLASPCYASLRSDFAIRFALYTILKLVEVKKLNFTLDKTNPIVCCTYCWTKNHFSVIKGIEIGSLSIKNFWDRNPSLQSSNAAFYRRQQNRDCLLQLRRCLLPVHYKCFITSKDKANSTTCDFFIPDFFFHVQA